ncbi:MAG: polysaccharide biosynthesis tyrosine autokinase [Parvibaculum sp.]|uniref:GumC family protein n=1 Tax=Parvibaculum sp. TaxID=2024848 RepID=UPI00272310B8|nr:polysaccharide biosynthesis tyrosine autokinase [Parvibaculum sp.]MDO8837350.1 polysaccharide biosynthesis tyrosine autokinase [Parvibaculum sp.]
MNAPVKGTTSKAETGVPYDGREGGDEGLLDLDLKALYRTLRKRLGVIVGITIGVTALAMVWVFQQTPIYVAEVQILLDRQKMQIVDMQAVMSGLSPDSASVDSEVQILRSRTLAARVVENLKLTEDPEFNGALREPSMLRWLDPRVWIGSVLSLLEPEPLQQNVEELALAELNRAINGLLGRLTVTRQRGSYVIAVGFLSENPAKAARIANAIAETYILDQLDAKFDGTRQANEWLSRRLTELRQQVRDSERAVEIYRAEQGLETPSGVTLNEQELSELNAQLILARASLAEVQARYSRARQIRATGGSIESVTDVIQSGTITALRQKQAELARELANLSSKYGPRHPEIVNAEAQRRDIQRQIGAEIERIMGSLQNNVAVAESRVSALEENLREVRGETGAGGQALIQLRELEREASANRAVYESFLNRFKETSQQEDFQTPDSRVISAATPPGSPSYPRKGLVLVLALGLSGMLGVGVAFLLEHLDNGLQTGRDVEQALGLPHLVSLPATPAEKGADGKVMSPPDYLLVKPLSAFSESLRSLRSALQLSNVDNPPKIILFTSALPNEGKTTSSVSFARAAAASGLKVALIDCDLRHPNVHKAFGLKRPEAGLVEFLAERLDLAQVMVKDPKSDLDILPIATGTANPPDVLGSTQMKLLLERLRVDYDLVVLDSAPVLPVSDSRVLSRIADETVFVVRWNETPRDAAQAAIRELRLYDANIAGAVLAVVDTAAQAKYGYGDGGYYYGKYSRYYVN